MATDLEGVVRLEDQGVNMGELVSLGRDVLLDQVVLLLVSEDDMDLLGAEAADVRAEHDRVGGLSAEVLHLGGAVEEGSGRYQSAADQIRSPDRDHARTHLEAGSSLM